MDIGRAVLVVIDMQNGFVNHHSQHAVPAVSNLAERWSASGRPTIFTRYFNYPDSPYERLLRWSRLMDPPETDIVPRLTGLSSHARALLDKPGYTLFTPEATDFIREAGWTTLVFCGIATESCVLKSATDAFESGYTPYIVTDSCASDAGPDVHEAGLVVARRLIGRRQLVTAGQVVHQLTAHSADPVLE